IAFPSTIKVTSERLSSGFEKSFSYIGWNFGVKTTCGQQNAVEFFLSRASPYFNAIAWFSLANIECSIRKSSTSSMRKSSKYQTKIWNR
ncbi:hypothetical protein PMAYCL1PPCAC_24848, partial [Pristionchus mayeri]